MNANDFLISLGFDVKKVEQQIKGIESKLSAVAASFNIKSSKAKTEAIKQNAVAEVEAEKGVAKKKTDIQDNQLKQAAAKRKKLINELRRMQTFKDMSQDFGKNGRDAAAQFLRQARKALRDNKLETFLDVKSNMAKQLRDMKKKPKLQEDLSTEALLAKTKQRLKKAAEERERVKMLTQTVDEAPVQQKKTRKKISDEDLVQAAIERRQRQELQREEAILRVVQAKNAALAKEQVYRRTRAVEALTANEKNPQLKAMSNYYRNQRIEAKAQTATLEQNAHVLAFQKRQARLRDEEFKQRMRADTRDKIAAANRTKMQPTLSQISTRTTGNAKQRGFDKKVADAFGDKIINAKNVTEAKQYATVLNNVVARMDSLSSSGKRELLNLVKEGNIANLQQFNAELARTHYQMSRAKYQAFSLANAQDALKSSTRNLVREYASLYMAIAGVGYIKEQAKAMDGVAAGMTAVSENAQEVARSIQFVKDEALKNGLAVGEAAKSYVKLRAAIGDKATLKETEEMFQSITKAGVVFQLSQEDLTGTIKAVSQMFAKGKIQAKFFGPLRRNTYRKLL